MTLTNIRNSHTGIDVSKSRKIDLGNLESFWDHREGSVEQVNFNKKGNVKSISLSQISSYSIKKEKTVRGVLEAGKWKKENEES